MSQPGSTVESSTKALDEGSYEVVRRRLLEQVAALVERTEKLNGARKALFGASSFELVQSSRVRTENNGVARDMLSFAGSLLFAFEVALGLKSQPSVADVLSLYRFDPESAEGLEPLSHEGTFLADQAFVSEFGTAFRYAKEARILQLKRTDKRLLIVVQIGAVLSDVKVFRFSIDAKGNVKYIDARGEEDYVPPPSFGFAWKRTGREEQVSGPHPHVNVLDEVFVETIGGDLTIKVENNTKDGRGIYREPVADANQTLDDAEISYAKVGALILLKVKPFREEETRYYVYNTIKRDVVRVDAIGQSCLELPEDQGIIFPGGHYVTASQARVVDTDTAGMRFESMVRAPNGEDVLYVFYRADEGVYLLLPYNLITKETGSPVRCNGYSLFEDGTMAVFRAQAGTEPTRVHPFQVWKTPFCTQEHAELRGKITTASYLAKVGNASLVRGISDAFAIRKLATDENPTRRTFEQLVSSVGRALDDHFWIGHAECMDLASVLREVRKSADAILSEFEKVEAYKAEAARALAQVKTEQADLLRTARPEDAPSAEAYLAALSALRTQRGKLVQLRELRYMDAAAVDVLDSAVQARLGEIQGACITFFQSESAWQPVVQGLESTLVQVTESKKVAELTPHRVVLDRLQGELTVLGETVSGLEVEDATVRTLVLEQLSKTLAVLNRCRAGFEARRKELYGKEGRAELAVQLGVFSQAVAAAVVGCDTPEACDAELGKLLLRLEELGNRFGDLEEFAAELETKRSEVTESFGARRQTLSDERHKRAAALASGAERMLAGIARKAATFDKEEELLAYFASDVMVQRAEEAAKKLQALGENVRADEVATQLKVAKQDAIRKLRDKRELADGEGIRLGPFRFSVTKSVVDLVLVPREQGLCLHLTGTDFFEPLSDPALVEHKAVWEQSLASENEHVYRGEYLAFTMLAHASKGASGLDLPSSRQAIREQTLAEQVADFAAKRLDEGYERGVHDVDAAAILAQLLPAFEAAGPLRFTPASRALCLLCAASLPPETRTVLGKRASSVVRLRDLLGDARGAAELAQELGPIMRTFADGIGLSVPASEADDAATVLIETLAQKLPKFPVARASDEAAKLLRRKLDEAGEYRAFQEELLALQREPKARFVAGLSYARSLSQLSPELLAYAVEIAAITLTEGQLDREVLSAETQVSVTGLLGTHARIKDGALAFDLPEFLTRLRHFKGPVRDSFRAYRALRAQILDRERERLRLSEFVPKVLSSFVRNRLISEVYLPLVGANLAKQIGALGDQKRTDRMGLLFLISPPGYGKTTLMEYVASVLGLVFVKVNGPALGHDVTSLDPAACKSMTARQEVERVNLAFEMGNNVMLYVDDVQHTSPEFLEKFISLCDAQRKVEGVYAGRSQTYDFRGKRFCVVMAANPYTESGARFRIPDMLANRADTYNLGEVLGGREETFALSYIENALTSHPVLAPLSGRDPQDLYKLVRMAQGETIPSTDLSYGYSAAELSDVVTLLRLALRVQTVLLRVNQEYIKSASQEDAYRTEPPFKLQGSYRNMNKIIQKLAVAMTPEELERAITEHYDAESQTLTTGAEQNLLKLAELRGLLTGDAALRWQQIKEGFGRARRGGKEGDDPVSRITSTLGGLEEQLQLLNKAVDRAAAGQGGGRAQEQAIITATQALQRTVETLGHPEVNVTVANPHPQIIELEAIEQLGQSMARAVARLHGEGSAPASISGTLLQKLEELKTSLARTGASAGAGPVDVDLRNGASSNLMCDASGVVCGAFVGTYAKCPPVRTPLVARLIFPGDNIIEVAAVVQFVQDEDGDRPAGFGLRFSQLPEDGRRLVALYVRHRDPVLYDLGD